jgi:1,4-dihydroxy-2-naphthoate octaprenyltransferase
VKKIGLWVKAMRAPFFQAAIIPVMVGTAVAYWETGNVYWGLFVLTMIANAAMNGGTNLANDYYDHLSGDDVANAHPTTFSGGSRVIQEKLVTPRAMLMAAMISFVLASSIGVYLTVARGITILWMGVIGTFIAFFYTAPPFKLSYRGLGEIVVFAALGPLSVLGSYFVQAQTLSWAAFFASIPVGLLVAGILYINEFPDYEPDKEVGKNHLIVRLGREKAAKGYVMLLGLIYISILVPVVFGVIPWLTFLVLITVPMAVQAGKTALVNYNSIEGILPAMGTTIKLHLLIGLLLTLSYVLSILT